MNQFKYVALACLGLMVGCSDNDKDNQRPDVPAQPNLPQLSNGAFNFSIENGDDIQVGQYYKNADDAFLLINNDEQRAETLYYLNGRDNWLMLTSGTAPSTIKFANTDAMSAEPLALEKAAGHYKSQFMDQVIAFNVDQQGRVSTQGTGCSFQGQLSESKIPNTLSYKLSTQNCVDQIPQNLQGYWVANAEYQPVQFRMLNTNDKLLDLWLYPDEIK